jgi:hypothetical protein
LQKKLVIWNKLLVTTFFFRGKNKFSTAGNTLKRAK